jgi:hypothetical protein
MSTFLPKQVLAVVGSILFFPIEERILLCQFPKHHGRARSTHIIGRGCNILDDWIQTWLLPRADLFVGEASVGRR